MVALHCTKHKKFLSAVDAFVGSFLMFFEEGLVFKTFCLQTCRCGDVLGAFLERGVGSCFLVGLSLGLKRLCSEGCFAFGNWWLQTDPQEFA